MVSGHASPSTDVIIIGEYSIPRHVITTFSLRVDNMDSLPLASNGRKELRPSEGESPVIGLGDLTRGTEQFTLHKCPFTLAIIVAQLNAIFDALKFQPAAILSRF